MRLIGYDRKYFFHIQHTDLLFQFSDEDLSSTQNDLTRATLSFEVEEEEYSNTIITFTVRDDIGITSKACRRGQKLKIKWGIKNEGSLLGIFSLGSDEITSSTIRGPVTATVITSNGFFSGGKHFRTVVLRATKLETRAKLTKTFESGTYESIIRARAEEMGYSDSIVSFPEKSTEINPKRCLIQSNETNHEFLLRLALKFGCILIQCLNDKGSLILIFSQTLDLLDKGFTKIKGQTGNYHYFDYGNNQSNLLESPKYDLGTGSSMGSSASISKDADGKLVATFTSSETEKTTQYVLNTDKVRKALRSVSPAEALRLNVMVQSASFEDFMDDDKIKPPFDKYFDVKTFTTAPEQMGWSFEAPVVPDPVFQIGDRCWIGPKNDTGESVIPPEIKSYRKSGKNALWRLAKSKWKHDGGGVSQDLVMKR
ncbi:late control protein [Leptospira andrefontaineae]|uniref:Late control protein n=1 Tax=Leptospira andrefontaineae TaxID=2484976 RepID=A0A4R9GX53_9LEPT|nr:late control protein [Leptospira andrefontaineae]TGK36277.1 late control protein [Leptospira andrefontaineae]